PSDVRARLFEPFFTTKPSGTGLGLAVSQAIAEAHGGRIDVDAGPLGGARFTLSLPAPSREQVAAA
ncbi:ATP-binding protein, partial [Corallococcus sp. 4LFB]|uniref:ATP-binding protein n=1 Tax=Corallococcus sp. 4LFB TaxID=3383249 RepID=UPI003976EA87